MKKFYLFLIFSCSLEAQEETPLAATILYETASELQHIIYIDELYDLAYHNTDTLEAKGVKKTIELLYKQALKYYIQLIEEFPTTILVDQARYEKANIEFNIKKYDDAKKSYQAVLDKSPIKRNQYESLIALAFIAFDKNEYQSALEYLEKAKKYKLEFFCGNDLRSTSLIFENLYTKCLVALNKK